ncbi:MAG: hypothetical protein AAGF32_09140, partial [Pseudomonadota bacterium]
GDVLGELAQENGTSLQIAPELAQITRPYWYMNASPIHFAEQIVKDVGGVVSVKNGKMTVAKPGSGTSTSGGAVGTLTLTPPLVVVGSLSVKFQDRPAHKEVEAEYHDQDKAKRETVKVPTGHPYATKAHRIRKTFADKAEAEQAAKSAKDEMARQEATTSVQTPHNVGSIFAGIGLTYAGIRPQVDGLPFMIDSVTKNYSKGQGLLASITAKTKAGE